jgi:hypothetical protein
MTGLVTIPTTDLAAGDVLLYRGTGWLAKAIRLFDGTEVNHAGLFVDPEVVEALGQGVVRQGLDQSLADREFVLARRLKQAVPLSPVCAKGLSFVGTRYAFEQLLLLAVLSLTRKPKVTPVLRFLVRRVLDAAVGLLNEMIQRAAGARSEPMICSELVYRSFDEAVPGPDDLYSLRISDLPAGAAAVASIGRAATADRPRGRGISPDSLLAWASSSSTRVWSAASPAPAIASQPEKTTIADVEATVREYLDEVTGKAPATATLDAAKSVGDQDLRQAIDRFAAAYHQLDMKRTGAVTAALPGEPLQHLLKTAADFVTPGDLLRTESLFTVGYVQLP